MINTTAAWQEIYDGGSPEAEREIFLALAEDMRAVQEANRLKAGAGHPSRTLHAKMVAGVTNAVLMVGEELPDDLAVGHFRPGAKIEASLRLSNASGVPQQDSAPDMRGAALRLRIAERGIHDLLMTSFPVSHARNARQFVEFAVLAAGDRENLIARLVEKFGPEEAQRMGANIRQGVRLCSSMAMVSFWSRGAILWGTQPVRFQLRPLLAAESSTEAQSGPDSLRDEFADRLAAGAVRYRFAVQRYVDEISTPIEDGAVEWTEEASPPIPIATLDIPQQDLLGAEGREQSELVDEMKFNPWNAPPEFRPLGNINRARGVVYARSAEGWSRTAAQG
ncbi:hypothetical protein [Azospirillum endophyticum]